MTETTTEKTGLGPNQRRIIEILTKKKHLTQREIAEEVYGHPIKVGDLRYTAINRSLLNLVKRGLISKTSQEIQWSLKKKRGKKDA